MKTGASSRRKGPTNSSPHGSDYGTDTGLDNPDLGPFLLKLARNLIASGDNPQKALECASRAARSLERCSNGKPDLELVTSLHTLAAIHCGLGHFEEAIAALESSIKIPALDEGPEHGVAAFAGNMQLGDAYAVVGRLGDSLDCYRKGLEIQKQVLGSTDPRVGETCRYLAEAHLQAMQFDEAQELCQHALEIHRMHSAPASPEEAADKRLLALIYEAKGEHESALENLVLASMALISNGRDVEVAHVDCSIGDSYSSLRRFDEAVFAYQKALTVIKSANGENHPAVAGVYVRLADLYSKTGRPREARTYSESALRIYGKPTPGRPPQEIAGGLAEVAAIYEAMDESDQALRLLRRALNILDDGPGQQTVVAGIRAQMGVIYYALERHRESRALLQGAVDGLRAIGEGKSAFFGIVLNQTGLACVQCRAIREAAGLFEEARVVLEQARGPCHPDTLAVYNNLAGAYDALGRSDEAIGILEHVIGVREEKLGTANPDADDERRRLAELLKEAGGTRKWKPRRLRAFIQSVSLNARK